MSNANEVEFCAHSSDCSEPARPGSFYCTAHALAVAQASLRKIAAMLLRPDLADAKAWNAQIDAAPGSLPGLIAHALEADREDRLAQAATIASLTAALREAESCVQVLARVQDGPSARAALAAEQRAHAFTLEGLVSAGKVVDRLEQALVAEREAHERTKAGAEAAEQAISAWQGAMPINAEHWRIIGEREAAWRAVKAKEVGHV